MSDSFKTGSNQETNIKREIKERERNLKIAEKQANVREKSKEKDKSKDDKAKEITPFASYYEQGLKILGKSNFIVELVDGGSHCNHRILKSTDVPEMKGVKYPGEFKPLQDIYSDIDLQHISELFKVSEQCSQEVAAFWAPLFNPKSGDSDLLAYTQRKLKMEKISESRKLMEAVHLGHSFDPAGRLGKGSTTCPRTWVPDREWFAPALRSVTMEDVFTIFPKAEIQMLKLILGRIGVGVSNHIPDGWTEAISHTARMAAVIVGKDAGLGKSTLFNGMTAAFAKCGFVTQTFRSTDERFGMKATSLANIA